MWGIGKHPRGSRLGMMWGNGMRPKAWELWDVGHWGGFAEGGRGRRRTGALSSGNISAFWQRPL